MPNKQPLLSVNDVHGVWAILSTPAKPGAEDWRMENTVDLEETARVVDGLIKAGIDGILSLGTFGECSTLTWEEKQQFMSVVVETARGRLPVFGGTTKLNTRDTIRHTRWAKDLGMDGTMLGIPMWCAPSVDTAVTFYRDVAEACPDMAICIYANPEAFKFNFPPPFWAQVSKIPQVIMTKYIGVAGLLLNLEVSGRRLRFLSTESDYYGAARMAPEDCTAFWTGGALCGPRLSLALRDTVKRAKETGDWSAAKRLSDEIAKAAQTLFPNGSFHDFSMYNIGLVKEYQNAAGWMKAGPCRPPYHVIPEPYLEGARETGRRIAALNRKLESGELPSK
jgi:trans-o-hydroxybenzylidenepyruvate hydratase-aldolase